MFSGAFNTINFKKEQKRKLSVALPEIDVKPLDIVEPQMLGKSSLKGNQGSVTGLKFKPMANEFNPNIVKNNSSINNLNEIKPPTKRHTSAPNKPFFKFKTIFISKHLPIDTFDDNKRFINTLNINSLNKSTEPDDNSLPPEKIENVAKPQIPSKISTKQKDVPINNTISPKVPTKKVVQEKEVAPVNKPQPAPAAPVKKEQATLQSIFLKYQKLNKKMTKIVHKKNGNRNEKWVFFSDGTSVLEDPGEEIIPETEKSLSANKYPNAEDFKIQAQNEINSKNSNTEPNQAVPDAFLIDSNKLVAEFDPKNDNNIAVTLYEITTLQTKHLFCKYFDPTVDPKYTELQTIVDFEKHGNPSIYHDLSQMNDEDLLKTPTKKKQRSTHYWTKTLRKSNKGSTATRAGAKSPSS